MQQVRIVGVSVLRLLVVGALGFVVAGCEEWFKPPDSATITVEPPDTVPSFGGRTVNDLTYTVGALLTLILPRASGGDGALNYSLEPTVPGLRFDRDTRTLSDTPTDQGTYRMTYTVEDEDGDSDTLRFTITVEPPDTAPSFGGQTVTDQSYTVGEQIATMQLPAASGGDGRLSYALRPQVPGVTFDTSARLLSGTPTDSGTYRMTYTVEDEDGDSDTLKYTVTVEPPDTAPSFGGRTVTDQSYTVGEQIATMQLPAASGGDGRLSYALRPQVPGVAFDTSARLLSGTPTDSGTYRMTYTVEDEDGDTDLLTFTITIWRAEPPNSRPDIILDAREFHGYKVFHLNPDGEFMDDRPYSLLLGHDLAQVYVISTNARHTTEVIHRDSRETSRVTLLDPSPGRRPDAATRRERDMALPNLGPLPDRSWVQEYNANPPHRRARVDNSQRLSSVVGPQLVAEGDRETFLDLDRRRNIVRIPATARRVVTAGAQTLAVWVADADWGVVRQEMVDALAFRFLRPGPANDIYDWVTAALGPPWGPHDDPVMISPQAAQQVHILMFDIDGDGPVGGVLGFFFGKDLVLKEHEEASNERVMFYLDSHWLAHQEGPTWEVTDPFPETQIETMAHEFQHIIYWYHKAVLHDLTSIPTWLNEMASLVAEDLVSEKLPVHGPRGVAGDDPTAGRPGNRRGRLPLYNDWADLSVTQWFGAISYSVNYALGAYLARTYGGAALFRSIVQSELVGVDAIEEALRARGHDVSFGDILVDWAVAGLLSDDTGARPPYRYNSGTWSTSSAGGLMFRLGSINLFNYCSMEDKCYVRGPWATTPERFNESTARSPQNIHSNRLISIGVKTGTVHLRISADSGNRFTVLVKDQ